VRGSCHEAGIQFDQEIDPEAFLLPSSLAATGVDDQLGLSMKIPTYTGCLLLADDSETDRRLFAHQLSATGLVVMPVATSGAALDALRQTLFDAVICALDLESGGGLYAVQKMRENGYRGPILVFTAEISVAVLSRVQEAGADEVLSKPYDAGYVMYLLGDWLNQPAPSTPLISQFDGEPGMAELLLEFIEEARRLGQRLGKAAGEEDFAVVRELCLRLSGSGSSHGFSQLSAAARDALRALDASGDILASMGQVRRLISFCERMRCADSVPLPPRDPRGAARKRRSSSA
jgi:CheY-like chemotaxis protein